MKDKTGTVPFKEGFGKTGKELLEVMEKHGVKPTERFLDDWIRKKPKKIKVKKEKE